ncbi:hypothetical protein [Mycobacterium intracellulare]|uniref:Uncharacterized protein n=1 Tax=Mycobacterium intracellulare TaxID=1767 RepID=A0AAE4RFU6_MYCIT|nr:hypothetical protein [Mycobacterium intracellulare]MDV6979669.1 hypothetical protein [Mycobacterium intracellulare]MDV6985172.1 hypothetical protein [Mycobacterium intracellulare]MDV7014208.1 hypothetical protein [Mycobacterium intracellulare]MDV7030163.1 hypothetical protein [Mycobacterium intracellulare]
MPLGPSEVNIEERKQSGRDAAAARNATEPKSFGQTSESNYPYTYWWLVGYNEIVEKANG